MSTMTGTRKTEEQRTVALKYCGGCDPTYDRVACFETIKLLAGDRIVWVPLDGDSCGDCAGILVITGCPTACPERDVIPPAGVPLVVIRNKDCDPQRTVDILLNEVKP
jgi:hypothetical protein